MRSSRTTDIRNERPVLRVLEHLKATQRIRQGQWCAQCPAHRDEDHGLSVAEQTTGRSSSIAVPDAIGAKSLMRWTCPRRHSFRNDQVGGFVGMRMTSMLWLIPASIGLALARGPPRDRAASLVVHNRSTNPCFYLGK
jgi:hypothetical protein